MLMKPIRVGEKSLETNERLTMLRAFALSKKGSLADELFSYPVKGTAQSILPMTVKPLMFPEDSIWKHLGAKPHSLMPAEHFYEMLERDSLATPAVADYRLCGYLVDRNLDAFVKMLPSYYYSMTTRASSSMTLSPTFTQMAVTLPAFSACRLLAIFMASSTTTVSPA